MEFIKHIKHGINILKRYILFYFFWPLAFKLYSIKPVDEKLITFAYNKNYTTMPDNLCKIYDYLKAKGYNCVIQPSPQKKLKRIIFGIKFQKYYARSKVIFITDNFDLMYHHKPNEGTKVVQLWHACGAFKKWGYSTLDLAWGGTRKNMTRFPTHNTYTDAFVSSKAVIPCYAEAFNCDPKIIKPFGVPRTDIYFDKDFLAGCRDELLKAFPGIGDRKIILYAPTFRGNSPSQSYNEDVLDYAALKENFGDKYALVLKLHPFTASKFSLTEEQQELYGDFVFNATSLPIEVHLGAADLLIADYSSLIFEYSLFNKPMIFYAYDLEEYDRDRSFYFEYKHFVPGKIVRTNEEIIEAIKNRDFQEGKIPAFRKKFMSACDGHCTERIAEYCIK